MYSAAVRADALRMVDGGATFSHISRTLGVNRSTVREWVGRRDEPVAASGCFHCDTVACVDPAAYCYLLGQYLGDGHLVTSIRTPRLRIVCADSYPGIAAEVDEALRAVSRRSVVVAQMQGCTQRGTYWMHWPCLLPQHGPGRKHERPIVLADWQQDLVDEHPWSLIRGLIHSDGCRAINRVSVRGRSYSYPRYFFANESRDIMAILQAALDRVGVDWRMNRPNSLSVARRDAVAIMEDHVGAKT